MKHLQGIWDRLAEPRVQRIGYLLVYLLHIVAGMGILTGTFGSTPEELIGHTLTITWSGFLITGGVAAAIAVLPGWNFVERWAIGVLSIGIILCSVVVISAPPPITGTRIAIWAIVTAWVVIFALRGWEIRTYLVAPPARN